MRRIVFIAPWGEALGGAEVMLLSLLRHLDQSRVSPAVVFLQPGPFEQQIAELGIETRSLDAGRMRETRRLAQASGTLARMITELRPDVTCAWSAKTQLYAAAARIRQGKRARGAAMWWQHAIPDGGWLDRTATRTPAVAIGCSSHAGARAQQRLSPRRVTHVVHPGIDDYLGEPAGSLRAELGIPIDRVVVTIVGRLQPWKNQHRLLEAVALLRSEGLPVHALVIGGSAYNLSPGYAELLDAETARLELHNAVTKTGHVADPRRLLPAADILVNASDGEPFGIVLIEGMSAGLPVVAVGVGGPTEIVEHERTGLLTASSEPEELAASLRRLVGDEELRARLGNAGRARFEERFTAEHMAEAFATSAAEVKR